MAEPKPRARIVDLFDPVGKPRTCPRRQGHGTFERMDAVQQDTEALRRMTPEQKLAVMHGLIRQAWELKAAVIRAREPDLPEHEVSARAWELVGGDRP